MPYHVSRSNGQISLLSGNELKQPIKSGKVKVFYDTEFTFTDKLIVDAVQLYSQAISKEYAVVFPYEDLSKDFNPLFEIFKAFNHDVKPLTDESLDDLLVRVQTIYEEITDECKTANEIRKAVTDGLGLGVWDEVLKEYNLSRDNLKYVRKKGDSEVIIVLPKIEIEYVSFFADVDLFKSIGQNWQSAFSSADLESRRVIKVRQGSISLPPTYINGTLYELSVTLRDAMNRFPPGARGLDNQCSVYKADVQKLNIETSELASRLGLTCPSQIKQNMSLVRTLEPLLFAQYGAVDVFATDSLSDKHQELLNGVRNDFKLPLADVKDTTGSNVSSFVKDLIQSHFQANEETKSLITSKVRQGNADNLQKIELNDFGIQTFRTVGGLLYSRTARKPLLTGNFGDLDESSCYATKLSNLTIYLGQPIVTSFKGRKYKPQLKEVINFLISQCPRDAWFIRVTGKFTDVLNTIVLSDLSFKPKKERFKTIFDVDPGRRSIGTFNAYKTSNPEAQSTLLLKEIKFGLINADIWDVIKLLPESWVNEYLSLLVDAIVFIPNELICDTTEELIDKLEDYPDDEAIESFNRKTGLKNINAQFSKKNVCLRFPISDYYNQLKAKRKAYKQAKNPIQEVYKLFLNSGYGALACEHLPVNNLLAANQITASARATSWLMMNALNGFQVITDGCTFSWDNVPLGKKFKDVISSNPWYLVDFDPTYESGLKPNQFNQDWINAEFKNHLHSFYNVDQNHIPVNLYDFELKTEVFNSDIPETCLFTEFLNHGSGSYCKGLKGNRLLIEGAEYNIANPQFKKVKARSFKGNDSNLLDWYVRTFESGYTTPYIYQETQIIKFGDANQLAIRLLDDESIDKIAHPMGFTKKQYKLMKLITRSQFLFLTEKQLRNFETTNQLNKLDKLSKSFLTGKLWQQLTPDDLSEYGAELRPGVNYSQYSKDRPIGLGFELLCLNRSHKGSLESVRNLVADKIREGVSNFEKALHLNRNVELAGNFTKLFAALTVLRANADEDLKEILVRSSDEPTVFVVTSENVCRLEDLFTYPES